MGVVVGSYLLGGEGRVEVAVDIVLLELADEQRLAVGLHLFLDAPHRVGEEHLGLVQLELLLDPAVDEELHERHAVVARNSLGKIRNGFAHTQFVLAGTGKHGIAVEDPGGLLTARDEDNKKRTKRRSDGQTFHREGKDTVFTRN